jgi:hypothetical protein
MNSLGRFKAFQVSVDTKGIDICTKALGNWNGYQ